MQARTKQSKIKIKSRVKQKWNSGKNTTRKNKTKVDENEAKVRESEVWKTWRKKQDWRKKWGPNESLGFV